MALLYLYKQIYGPAFRPAQLAYDVKKVENSSLHGLISPELLRRTLAINSSCAYLGIQARQPFDELRTKGVSPHGVAFTPEFSRDTADTPTLPTSELYASPSVRTALGLYLLGSSSYEAN
jgi:hypothetical protein